MKTYLYSFFIAFLLPFNLLYINPKQTQGEDWMRGRWRVTMESTNLAGWFGIGVSSKTGKVFGVSGSWGPEPRDTDYMRFGVDEEVKADSFSSTNRSLSFRFISQLRIGSRGNHYTKIARRGFITLEKINPRKLAGTIECANGVVEKITFEKSN